MNTHITAHKAKVRHQCFFLILCFQLAYAGVPGPCKHSVTQDHLLSLKRLIKNQLQNGCSITYSFTERQNLSVVCYVKAAFPHILELLNGQFRYAKDSDNHRYTNSLKNLILNIYSQRCIPSINEEIEDSPTKFVRIHMTLPRAALEKAEEVIRLYMDLMTQSDKPVDWNCEEEYTEDYPESTTEALSQTAGASECPCICPTARVESSKTSTSHWNIYLKSTPSPQTLFSPAVTLQSVNKGAKPRSAVPPATQRSTQGDLSNFLYGSTPNLQEDTSNIQTDHMQSLDLFPSHRKFKDVFPRRTDSTIQSTMSGLHQKGDNMEKSTPLLLAKRSLDSKNQDGPSHSHVKLSKTRVTVTSEPTNKDLETAEIKDEYFPSITTVPVTTTVLPFLREAAHSPESLSALDEQPGQLNSAPENVQTHTQSPGKVPGNFMEKIHETKLNKDSRSQEDTQTQISSASGQSSSTVISSNTLLIITLVCGGLLLITVLFYRQQKILLGPVAKTYAGQFWWTFQQDAPRDLGQTEKSTFLKVSKMKERQEEWKPWRWT